MNKWIRKFNYLIGIDMFRPTIWYTSEIPILQEDIKELKKKLSLISHSLDEKKYLRTQAKLKYKVLDLERAKWIVSLAENRNKPIESDSAEQNRLIIASIFIAVAIGVVAAGSKNIEEAVNSVTSYHWIATYLEHAPLVSGFLALLYVMTTATRYKFYERNVIGYQVMHPKLYVLGIRKLVYDFSVDIFWLTLIVPAVGYLALTPTRHLRNKILSIILVIAIAVLLLAIIGWFNRMSILDEDEKIFNKPW